MIVANIIADSVNKCNGRRLTSFLLEYPRFIHSELLTHRVFSKNSASSRAIPFDKFVEQVLTSPALPVFWGANQKGMQAVEEIENKAEAHKLWLETRDEAIRSARKLNNLGLHKQICNRILEPWFNIRVILTGTEFDNFFKLRAHKDAQPEIQALAYKMLDAYNQSKPEEIGWTGWHIPFGDTIDNGRVEDLVLKMYNCSHMESSGHVSKTAELTRKIAIARCARVSYLNYEGKDDYEADIKLCDRLFQSDPKHLSPTEHVAQAVREDTFIGNFRGWKQYRKFIE